MMFIVFHNHYVLFFPESFWWNILELFLLILFIDNSDTSFQLLRYGMSYYKHLEDHLIGHFQVVPNWLVRLWKWMRMNFIVVVSTVRLSGTEYRNKKLFTKRLIKKHNSGLRRCGAPNRAHLACCTLMYKLSMLMHVIFLKSNEKKSNGEVFWSFKQHDGESVDILKRKVQEDTLSPGKMCWCSILVKHGFLKLCYESEVVWK